MSVQHASSFRDLKEILAADADVGDSSDVSYEIKERAHKLCSKFLGGAWKTVPVDSLLLTRMKGGMSNMLFLCQFPKELEETLSDEPDKTLLRVYFNPETESHLVAESVIFTLLSERQLGPQLYGIFNGGRLEEYIVSRPLKCAEIRQEELSLRIARKLARIHRLNVPISKEPTYICEALERWINRLRSNCCSSTIPVASCFRKRPKIHKTDCSNNCVTKIRAIDLDQLTAELHFIKRAIGRSNSPVVFSHNDLQEGNILLPNNRDCGKDLVVIDFEYASYNYRGFDFANHFCEWAIEYGKEAPPHFSIDSENFPSPEQQIAFIEAYLDETDQILLSGTDKTLLPITDQRMLRKRLSCSSSAAETQQDFVERFREEIECFVPVSHFFWGVWAMLQVELSPVRFGFAEYARDRLALYFKLRANLTRLINKAERGTKLSVMGSSTDVSPGGQTLTPPITITVVNNASAESTLSVQ